ncbi:MAG: hypothetical protein ACRYGP_16250 [Janthinobacterium lividum]
MTKLLDDTVAVVRRQASDWQDEITAAIFDLAENAELWSPSTRALGQLMKGSRSLRVANLASDNEAAAAFRRHIP